MRTSRRLTPHNPPAYSTPQFFIPYIRSERPKEPVHFTNSKNLQTLNMSFTYKSNATTLMIKNLPDDFIENDLQDLFSAYGNIKNKNLGIDQTTGETTGEALVQFENGEVAEQACREMANCLYQGYTLNVALTHFRWPQPEATLMVSNLPGFITVKDLEEIFMAYGPMIRSSLPIDRFTWNAKGYGFLEFRNEQIAQRALEEMDGTVHHCVYIQVNLAKLKINV